MFAEQNRYTVVERTANASAEPEFVTQPGLHRLAEHPAPARERRCAAGQDALELHQRLFIEDDEVKVTRFDLAGFEAVAGGVQWECGIVLLATETLLFRRGDDHAVAQQTGRRVVVEARETEDVHARTAA